MREGKGERREAYTEKGSWLRRWKKSKIRGEIDRRGVRKEDNYGGRERERGREGKAWKEGGR